MKRWVIILVVLSCLPLHATTLINGAGTTFPYPLYSKWFDLYHRAHPAFAFNYQSIGSGGGIRQLIAQTVDFGASDMPMTDAQLKEAPYNIRHIPTVMGGVAVVYSLDDVSQPLRLSGSVLAKIFLGEILMWNDPQIAALNSGVQLPARPILVVHRSDGAGTTFVLSDFLSKVSPDWRVKVGHGTSLKWPVGIGGKGNEGVSALVKQMPGAIGYVEKAFAMHVHLAMAALQNRNGEFVSPTSETVAAAAAGVTIPDDFRISITDSPMPGAYPLACFTYLLIVDPASDPMKGKALVDFLKWAMFMGQTFAAPLHYAPLPTDIVQRVYQVVRELK